MIGATRDQTDVLTAEAEGAGCKRFVSLALHLAEAELILLTTAPGVDDAFLIASESVVRTRSNVDDLLETRKEDRGGLHECVLVEAKDAFVTLDVVLASRFYEFRCSESDLLGKCPSHRQARRRSRLRCDYRQQRAW